MLNFVIKFNSKNMNYPYSTNAFSCLEDQLSMDGQFFESAFQRVYLAFYHIQYVHSSNTSAEIPILFQSYDIPHKHRILEKHHLLSGECVRMVSKYVILALIEL